MRGNWDHSFSGVWRKEGLRGDLIEVHNFLRRGVRWGGAGLSVVTSSKTWGGGMKLHWQKFRLDIRQRFFAEKITGTA